jgi:hypothetical protein
MPRAKKTTVSTGARRGRPKGSRNKATIAATVPKRKYTRHNTTKRAYTRRATNGAEPIKGIITNGARGETIPFDVEDSTSVSKLSEFEDAAIAVQKAVLNLNTALKAARECEEMRVEIWRDEGLPAQYSYRIYRLTHTVFTMDVRVPDKNGPTQWWEKTYHPVEKPLEDATVS